MKKSVRIVLIIGVIILVIIQFIQPSKNQGVMDDNHLFNQTAVPDNIRTILQKSCMDCHSNQTNYPWYDRIAPVSWMVNNHIREGKKSVNLSKWGNYSKIDKITILDNICNEITKKKMPLKSYTFIHRDTRLNEEKIDSLCAWTENLALSLLKTAE